jgi:hypothetical protein
MNRYISKKSTEPSDICTLRYTLRENRRIKTAIFVNYIAESSDVRDFLSTKNTVDVYETLIKFSTKFSIIGLRARGGYKASNSC